MRKIWKSLSASRESNHLLKVAKKQRHLQTLQAQATKTCSLRLKCSLRRLSQREPEMSHKRNRKWNQSKLSPRLRKIPISHNRHLSSASSLSRSCSLRSPQSSRRKNLSRGLSLEPSRNSHQHQQVDLLPQLRVGKRLLRLGRTKKLRRNLLGDHQLLLSRSQHTENLYRRRLSPPQTLSQGLLCARVLLALQVRIARAQRNSARMHHRIELGRTQQPVVSTQVNKASSPLL